jgi:hypothetical protein
MRTKELKIPHGKFSVVARTDPRAREGKKWRNVARRFATTGRDASRARETSSVPSFLHFQQNLN